MFPHSQGVPGHLWTSLEAVNMLPYVAKRPYKCNKDLAMQKLPWIIQVGFESEEMVTHQRMQRVLEAGKSKKRDCALETPDKHSSADTLSLAPWEPKDFWPLEL